MRLLLDTQVALWWLVGSPRLSRSCRDLIATSSCVVSVASIWEVAIKHRVGKLPIPPQVFRDEIQNTGAALLPIADVHAIATTEATWTQGSLRSPSVGHGTDRASRALPPFGVTVTREFLFFPSIFPTAY